MSQIVEHLPWVVLFTASIILAGAGIVTMRIELQAVGGFLFGVSGGHLREHWNGGPERETA